MKNEKMKEALLEFEDITKHQLDGGIPDPCIAEELKALCETNGYGNVMATASMLWREKDPDGAFLFGPCVLVAKNLLKESRKARRSKL